MRHESNERQRSLKIVSDVKRAAGTLWRLLKKLFQKNFKKYLTNGKRHDIITKLSPRATQTKEWEQNGWHKGNLKIKQYRICEWTKPGFLLGIQIKSNSNNKAMITSSELFWVYDYNVFWRFNKIKLRVWSWLRTNAGGAPNTCKSNEESDSLLELS